MFISICVSGAAAAAAGSIPVGCQTRAYGSPIRERDRLLSVLDDLTAVGYEGFETNFASLAHSFADPAPMRSDIEKRGIKLIGLHMGAGLLDPARLGEERRQISQVAKAVSGLGGAHLMLSSNPTPPEALERHTHELNQAGRTVRGLGVRLCFHNHAHELENGARRLKAVLANTDPDLVSLVLDVGNPFPSDFQAAEIVRRHGARIAAFHLRDTAAGKEVLMGEGEFDFAGLAGAIHQTRWSGWLIVELNRRPDIPSRRLVESARKYVGKVF